MSEIIYQIYDRIFKRIFALSNLAIINLINGLFGTNHPLDSEVIYPNKEFVSVRLDKRIADVFLIIQNITYHLEAQIKKDGAIVVRVFEYGFQYAMSSRQDDDVLHFPEPMVIYLDTGTEIPATSTLTLDFGSQGTFPYTVKNFLYQEHEMQELNRKKLVVLIPFQLLKLRRIIANHPTPENFLLLQNQLSNDILYSIKANEQAGNITTDDANQLWELTSLLLNHIYKHYEELGEYQNMKPLLEGALELPNDKYRIRIDELEQENTGLVQENTGLVQEKAVWEKEKLSLEEKTLSLEQENRKLKELLNKNMNH